MRIHPAFAIQQRPHERYPSVLSQWIEFEASFPNSPFEFFVPDDPAISDDTLEAKFKKVLHEFITASIQLRQARSAYGQCLATLARRKAAKRRRINAVSPASSLPDELLSYIFQLTARPILSSHVCHRWRAIAIDTSSLWCYFTKGMQDSQVKTFLKRSRNQPLSIYCAIIFGTIPINRIKELNLHLLTPAEIRKFCDHPAPSLESITLNALTEAYHDHRASKLFCQTLFAYQAPKLRKVKLKRCILTQFPTQSVTELILIYCVLPTVWTTILFLQSIPALQCLVLFNNEFEDDPPEMVDCQLSSLKRLSVSYSSRTNIKIIVPQLEDLILSAEGEEYPQVYPGSSLRHLWIRAEEFTRDGFQRIHAQLQDVQALEIGGYAMRGILSVLSNEDKSNKFPLPSLRKLFIHQATDHLSELGNLHILIQVRQVTVSHILPAYVKSRYIPDFNELCCTPFDPVTQWTSSASSDDEDEDDEDEDDDDDDEDDDNNDDEDDDSNDDEEEY